MVDFSEVIFEKKGINLIPLGFAASTLNISVKRLTELLTGSTDETDFLKKGIKDFAQSSADIQIDQYYDGIPVDAFSYIVIHLYIYADSDESYNHFKGLLRDLIVAGILQTKPPEEQLTEMEEVNESIDLTDYKSFLGIIYYQEKSDDTVDIGFKNCYIPLLETRFDTVYIRDDELFVKTPGKFPQSYIINVNENREIELEFKE